MVLSVSKYDTCAAHGAVSGRGSAWIPRQQAVDSCSWPQVPPVPAHLGKAPPAQHLKRAAWQLATVPVLKTGVSSPWWAPQTRNSASFHAPCHHSALSGKGESSPQCHNGIDFWNARKTRSSSSGFFITMYKQWQTNLQIRETDLIRHIRVQTHSLARQTERSVPAFSKCLTMQEGNLHRETKISVRS